MVRFLKRIQKATATECEAVLKAVLRRYPEVFPDWEVFVFAIEKTQERDGQIDQAIRLLESIRRN